MKVFLLALVILLAGCYMTHQRTSMPCGGGWRKHELVQDDRGEIKLPNGDKMVIFICIRKDWAGNPACNYRDTFYFKR